MDHRWGREVFEQGLGDAGATLAARFPLLGGGVYLTNAPGIVFAALAFKRPADTLPDAPYQVFNVLKLAPRFPYGYVVEPDGPV